MISSLVRRSTTRRSFVVLRGVFASSTTNTTTPSHRTMMASAQPAEERRRRTTPDRDPIIVTDRAAERISDLLRNHTTRHPDEPAPRGIRLGVKRRGCNGLSYTLNYVTDEDAVKKDITMKTDPPHSVPLYIEPMALFNVIGTTMDWEETELASEFTFSNPNSKGECGCGESFTV